MIGKPTHEPLEFVSNIFTVQQRGGVSHYHRPNPVDHFVQYTRFKMDTFETAKQVLYPGYFMACIDLQVAYFTVPITEFHRKFLKFVWKGQLGQYKALTNGLTTAP